MLQHTKITTKLLKFSSSKFPSSKFPISLNPPKIRAYSLNAQKNSFSNFRLNQTNFERKRLLLDSTSSRGVASQYHLPDSASPQGITSHSSRPPKSPRWVKSSHVCAQIRPQSTQASPPDGHTHPLRFKEPLGVSYAPMGGDEPFVGLTMGGVITRARDEFGANEAVVGVAQGVRVAYDRLYADSAGVAAGLLASGLRVGDRVGLWSGNCYEWVVTQWAAGLAGLVLVNINPGYVASELQFCLQKVAVRALVMAPLFRSLDLYAVLREACPQLGEGPPNALSCPHLPSLRTVILMGDQPKPGTVPFWELPQIGGQDPSALLDPVADVVQFDDPCNIQFTSGTTGTPKAAVLSHHNIVNNAMFVGRRCGYGVQTQRICLPVPLYHCFGCVAGTIAAAFFGAACVLPSPAFSPGAAYRALLEERVTSCYGTPTMFVDILAEARKAGGGRPPAPPPALVGGIMAGAPCPPELVQAVVGELGMRDFVVMYGLTETSPVCLQCAPGDPLHTRAFTVGFPGDHLEVRVVDSNGRLVEVGEEGELHVRGYSVFLGYWGDDDKTKEVIGEDRWFKTGDLAVMDESGYCCIRGRKKDMIIRGGENVYPAELENVYMTHPKVQEVQVFGIPDPRLGEVVVAWLRLQEGAGSLSEEEFKLWCRERVAAFKVPTHVMVKEKFPVTVTGKIQKFRMREDTIKELQEKNKS